MIDFGLSGKAAVVTGGTAGIGKAVVAQFTTAGARAAAVGRRRDGAAIAAEVGATFIQADVTSAAQMAEMLHQAEAILGRLDIVVLNAGIDPGQATIEDTDLDTLEHNFDVNFRHVFCGLKYARNIWPMAVRSSSRRPRLRSLRCRP